jgi:hypothetical protein
MGRLLLLGLTGTHICQQNKQGLTLKAERRSIFCALTLQYKQTPSRGVLTALSNTYKPIIDRNISADKDIFELLDL